MGRTTRRDNRDLPHLKPVEKVRLSEKHIKLRIALTALFFVIGVTALIYGLLSFLGGGDGDGGRLQPALPGRNTVAESLCSDTIWKETVRRYGPSPDNSRICIRRP